jgi:xylulose-5-phosphate/fructose-6-phosphate phosphoketolase
MPHPLSTELLEKMDAYWRAANYLSVGQIYLQDNPLLEVPLERAHIKPRLLGHWGTTAGLNFLYVHLNRLIKENGLDMIYVTGPGHGGPGLVAHTYLEGTYTETYPVIERSRNGLQRLFRQFSWPYGIPSHVAPETPGSIHEGGELGYSLAHAYGAAFDNPDLIVACIIGDGEAETGALAASWHSNKFLNPARDGAVLPILHLNGFKIANPTVLARISREELTGLLRGCGYDPRFVEGHEPRAVHPAGRDARRRARRHSRHPGGSARCPPAQAPALAGDRVPYAEGLDRAEIRGRQAGRGHLAGPPSPGLRFRKAGAPRHPGRLAQELPAFGIVR